MATQATVIQSTAPSTARGTKKAVSTSRTSTSSAVQRTAVTAIATPSDFLRCIPIRKNAIAHAAQERAAEVKTQHERFDLLVMIAAAEKYLVELKECVKSDAEHYASAQIAKDIHITETGVKYTFRSVTTWDFSTDAVHSNLLKSIAETKERVKLREDFLKTLTIPITENGQTVHPVRVLETKSSLSLTLPA